jgi:DNA replication licensing factor MCM7
MALLEFRAPVDYEKQQNAFQLFLTDFKTSPEQTITTAMGNITIDEDDLSDEYDFMDEDEQAGQRRRQDREQRKTPEHKYKKILQKLANREVDEIRVDLDDLAAVRLRLFTSASTSRY